MSRVCFMGISWIPSQVSPGSEGHDDIMMRKYRPKIALSGTIFKHRDNIGGYCILRILLAK